MALRYSSNFKFRDATSLSKRCFSSADCWDGSSISAEDGLKGEEKSRPMDLNTDSEGED